MKNSGKEGSNEVNNESGEGKRRANTRADC